MSDKTPQEWAQGLRTDLFKYITMWHGTKVNTSRCAADGEGLACCCDASGDSVHGYGHLEELIEMIIGIAGEHR